MTLEDDLRAQRSRWDDMRSSWGSFRIPESVPYCGTYYPGVSITKVLPPGVAQQHMGTHPRSETEFERIMRTRYRVKVNVQQSNYRPGTVRLNPFDEF